MANKIVPHVSYESYSEFRLGNNSDAFTVGDFVSISGNTAIVAAAGTKIVGVANSTVTFAADNETVALAKLSFTKATPSLRVEVAISGGTITSADEGKYYNLSDARTVDGTTESTVLSVVDTSDAGAATDPVITKQVKLEKFISATKGVFSVVL